MKGASLPGIQERKSSSFKKSSSKSYKIITSMARLRYLPVQPLIAMARAPNNSSSNSQQRRRGIYQELQAIPTTHETHHVFDSFEYIDYANILVAQLLLGHYNKLPGTVLDHTPVYYNPSAEVVALSPTTLMATNRFVCEICNKGFQRDQNLQLHRRGHNLPWKLRQRTSTEVRKRVYICPEPTCVHHNASRALGDLTGIKKHYSRKHGEKKWKCDKCSKKYAVQSDWKAHQKTCGTREYKCDCGTIFSRRDSFITHRAFCDALAEENNKVNQGLVNGMGGSNLQGQMPADLMSSMPVNNTKNNTGMPEFHNYDSKNPLKSLHQELIPMPFKPMNMSGGMFSSSSGTLYGSPRSMPSTSSGLQLSSNGPNSGFNNAQDGKGGQISWAAAAHMSATALLQKAAQMGATASNSINSPMMQKSFVSSMAGSDQRSSSYGAMQPQQQQNTSFENFQQTQPEQSNFSTQMMQKGPQDPLPQMFGQGTGSSAMNDTGMFSEMLMGAGDHQNHGFMKNVESEDSNSSNSSLIPGRPMTGMGRSPTGPSRFGSSGNDMMTVDFLGIGGSRPPDMEAHMSQQRMQQVINPFWDSGLEKPIWDV
ncbi:hypothetical protein RJ639_000450 [Escallonia herrerae]|uniref:C2H2-type domain-containing protein n=1 Tax=Escallonia herrerae TaxID=1293975 RepID=A0AA89BHP9_9ASTE|nr:hypothetical protein RJ639_000450 [Escallonia herrerae]